MQPADNYVSTVANYLLQHPQHVRRRTCPSSNKCVELWKRFFAYLNSYHPLCQVTMGCLLASSIGVLSTNEPTHQKVLGLALIIMPTLLLILAIELNEADDDY